MKKSIYIFICFFISVIEGCVNQDKLDFGKDIAIEYNGKNLKGREFIEKLGEHSETLREYLGSSKDVLFDHTRLGWMGQYGLHFSVPVLDIKSRVVIEYLIYPLDSYYHLEDYVVVDKSFLDSVARKDKFLYSKQFLRWKQEGLDVNSDLYLYAELLDGKIVPFDGGGVGIARSGLELGQYEGRIQYYIDCSGVGSGTIWGVTWGTRYDAFSWAEEQLYTFFPIDATWLEIGMDYVNLKITARSIQDYSEARRVFDDFVGEAEWYLSGDLPGVRIDYSVDMKRGTIPDGGSSSGGSSSGGSSTGGSSSGSSESSDIAWWGEGHRKILEAVLEDLNLRQDIIEAINRGSKKADKSPFQETKYAHMHAMRSPGDTEEKTIGKMRDFFVGQIEKYNKEGNFESVGMALHPIMDAYSPAHELKVWNGYVWSYVPHCFEASFLHYKKIQKAQDALKLVCDDLIVKGFFDRPDVVFKNWLYGPYGPKNPYNTKK